MNTADAQAIIVTAAGRGMGEAIARRLHRDGHHLALMSNSGGAEDLAGELGCIGLTGSVTDTADLERLVEVTPHMSAGGSIVNISTFSAFEPDPGFPISSSLRAGLASFTKLYSDRYAAEGIRMNNVLPGFIDSYEADESTVSRIPMGRVGKVAEIADTVAFLLSDAAGYITGQNLRVDGGVTRSV